MSTEEIKHQEKLQKIIKEYCNEKCDKCKNDTFNLILVGCMIYLVCTKCKRAFNYML
jgi:hypothetical protein